MYIFEPNRYKSVPFEKVPPQWQLLYLYFWEWWRHAVRLAFTHKDIRAFLHINTKLLLSFSLLNFHTSLDQNIIFFCRFLATANYNRELFRWGQSQKMHENKWKCFNGLKEKILSKEHAFYTSADAFTVLPSVSVERVSCCFSALRVWKRVDSNTETQWLTGGRFCADETVSSCVRSQLH